jgi:hypothetical protein
MATLIDEPSDVGGWLTISESDGSMLRALAHEERNWPEPSVTIFWPAREDPRRFETFFDTALPTVSDYRPGIDRFSRRLAYMTDSGEPLDLSQRNADFDREAIAFVRYEHLQVGRDIEQPVLVAWSNLDAGRQQDVPEDAAGVLVLQRNLSFLQEPLATLIANTSVGKPEIASVASMLEKLADHLSGRSEPMEVTA